MKTIKIQLQDEEGRKCHLSLEGGFTKEKITKVFELVEIFDNTSNIGSDYRRTVNTNLRLNLWNTIIKNFKYNKFTSSDILKSYNNTYNETIPLSIVSTYLSRFAIKKLLNRTKNGKGWVYSLSQTTEDYEIHKTNDLCVEPIKSDLYSIPSVYDL